MTDDEIIDFVENPIQCRENSYGAKTDSCKLKKFVGTCYAEYLKQNQKEKGVNNETLYR